MRCPVPSSSASTLDRASNPDAAPGNAALRRILERDRTMLDLATQLAGAVPAARQPDLTMRQVSVLHLVSTRPLSVGQLAAALGVTISSASGLVDRLVRAKLVSRAPGTADRRLVMCQATEEGVALLAEYLEIGRLQLETVLTELSPDELLIVENALDLVIAAGRAAVARAARTSQSEPHSLG